MTDTKRLRDLALKSNDGMLCTQALGAADTIDALAAECDSLKAELHDARMQSLVDFGKLQEACEENVALKAEVERLREALIPFSEEAGWWFEKNYNASDKVVEPFEDYYGFMTCGDLFRARAALQENTDD